MNANDLDDDDAKSFPSFCSLICHCQMRPTDGKHHEKGGHPTLQMNKLIDDMDYYDMENGKHLEDEGLSKQSASSCSISQLQSTWIRTSEW